MTKSEFWFSMIRPRTRGGNVRNLDPGRVNCQTRAAAPRARAMHNFFSRKFTKSRAHPPRGFDAPVSSQSSLQYSDTSTIFKKNSKKAVYRVFFLVWDCNTKSHELKKLPGKSKNYKGSTIIIIMARYAWNCKNRSAWASASIITDKKWISGKTSWDISGASISKLRLCPP
jgi:hypothetical protein